MRLTKSFFDRPTLKIAPEFIGSMMHLRAGATTRIVRIVEVEAYIGEDDPACHAAAGLTPRTSVMYGEPGRAYVYFIYGMYYCFNIVTEQKGYPAAILVRAAEIVEGLTTADAKLLAGPGKLCRELGITKAMHGMSVCSRDWYFCEANAPVTVAKTPRIGISKGAERAWRFYDAQSPSVSGRSRRHTRMTSPESTKIVPPIGRVL